MKRTEIICDVEGCKEDGSERVDCCDGYKIESGRKIYKKFEAPLFGKKDLCDKHYHEWAIKTYKILRYKEKWTRRMSRIGQIMIGVYIVVLVFKKKKLSGVV